MFTYTHNFLQNDRCFYFYSWIGRLWRVQLAVGRQGPPDNNLIWINIIKIVLWIWWNVYDYLSRIPQSSSSVASSQSRWRSQRDPSDTQLPELQVNSVWCWHNFLFHFWNFCGFCIWTEVLILNLGHKCKLDILNIYIICIELEN